MLELKEITKKQIDRCKSSPWDFGNNVLYDLCKQQPNHRNEGEILAKVWLIGRGYAAAIERGRTKKSKEINEIDNDDFYINIVAPAFKDSELDNYLDELKQYKTLTADNISLVLKTHHYLTDLTFRITGLEKRSFSSKYLHFHYPNLFFIYDSRAVNSLRKLIKRVPEPLIHLLDSEFIDPEYAKFVCKSFIEWKRLNAKYNTKMTIRQFDNLLMEMVNDN